ncbi:MAG TPA: hypothetical protein VL866_01215 [Pyrinomonadaceae bacterium]|nr:hypothetical protein [Pyrinomonadaceae bacterium]
METLKGRVSNIKRDVEVVGPDYSNDSYSSGSTTDVTTFMLAGRSMKFKSSRATYDAIAEGDELIVAGKPGKTVFDITAYKNLTKNLTSYEGRRSPIRVIAIAVIVLGIVVTAGLFFIGNSPMQLVFGLPFLIAGGLLLYIDYKYSRAIKAIESYR